MPRDREEKRHLSQLSDDEVWSYYEQAGCVAERAARNFGCGPSAFKTRVRLLKDKGYQASKDRKDAVAFLMEELEARGIDPRSVKVRGATVKTDKKRYNYGQKDPDTGKPLIVPMKSDTRLTSISFSPKFDEGPKWPVVQPASIGRIAYVPRRRAVFPKARRVFLWPDTQIGFYRAVQTGQLTPFHDLRAIDIALQMLYDFCPDEVIILGDFLDLPMLSKWKQYAEFQHTLQPSLQWGALLLSEIRSIVGPKVPIRYLAGNHELRFGEYVATNALLSHGVAPASLDKNAIDPQTFVPKSWAWPMHSIPRALQLDKLGIEYSAEYPSGEFWLNERNVCTHPPEKTTRREIRANVYHGHTPHVFERAQTIHHHPMKGTEEFTQVSVPGLMRTDDVTDLYQPKRSSVPSGGSRLNWQQGIGTVLIFSDKHEKHEIGRIKNGWGCLGEKQYLGGLDPLGLMKRGKKRA